MWRAEVELPLPGRYQYKFVINGVWWVDDPSHGLKEPDNYGGLNSVLNVAWVSAHEKENDHGKQSSLFH